MELQDWVWFAGEQGHTGQVDQCKWTKPRWEQTRTGRMRSTIVDANEGSKRGKEGPDTVRFLIRTDSWRIAAEYLSLDCRCEDPFHDSWESTTQVLIDCFDQTKAPEPQIRQLEVATISGHCTAATWAIHARCTGAGSWRIKGGEALLRV